MRIAQRLYEGVDIDGETVGLITYMRTDGVQLAARRSRQARAPDPDEPSAPPTCRPRRASTRPQAKNAQEAHEAIRPTDLTRTPGQLGRVLDRDERALYELIWKRTVASQMASAELDQVAVDIDAAGTRRRAARHRLGRRLRRLPRRCTARTATTRPSDDDDEPAACRR